jgi:hypothetical protein
VNRDEKEDEHKEAFSVFVHMLGQRDRKAI